ncbi:Hypothetical_protein [Hexamita inflata]|uniref:Hypothetical_protein n=1 Tax=Hexamita inflata TaxID=28002 RepID=A0AA86U5F4_9EUKA|nr:Hypothetical protein HINF_LOCUS26267 [Hexamita inflata]
MNALIYNTQVKASTVLELKTKISGINKYKVYRLQKSNNPTAVLIPQQTQLTATTYQILMVKSQELQLQYKQCQAYFDQILIELEQLKQTLCHRNHAVQFLEQTQSSLEFLSVELFNQLSSQMKQRLIEQNSQIASKSHSANSYRFEVVNKMLEQEDDIMDKLTQEIEAVENIFNEINKTETIV